MVITRPSYIINLKHINVSQCLKYNQIESLSMVFINFFVYKLVYILFKCTLIIFKTMYFFTLCRHYSNGLNDTVIIRHYDVFIAVKSYIVSFSIQLPSFVVMLYCVCQLGHNHIETIHKSTLYPPDTQHIEVL